MEAKCMKFFFCETCGKRITDQQVRDKKLKGVYCDDCANNVMTMEFGSALTDQQARAIAGAATASRVTKPHRSGLHAAAARPAIEALRSNAMEQSPAKRSMSRIVLISGAAFILTVVAFVTILASIRKSEPLSQTEATSVAPPKAPAITPAASAPDVRP